MNLLNNIHRDQVLDIAQRIAFLKDLTYPELCRFIDLRTHLFVYNRDECLIRDGERDNNLFILLTGSVGVYKDGSLLSTINSGDCFGEISFISDAPRTADIIAHERAIVIRLNHSTYNRLASEIREKIKDSIIRKLVTRIESMNQLCVSLQSEIVPSEFDIFQEAT